VGDKGYHFYKFGHSVNPAGRRKGLQTGNPRELEIFIKSEELDDCSAAEKDLMSIFKKYRCPRVMHGGREWFMVKHDDLEFRQRVQREIKQLNPSDSDSSDSDSDSDSDSSDSDSDSDSDSSDSEQ